MSTPILATKLYIPQPRPQLVSRPRLLTRLDQSVQQKLTLISAPAGFGKTTLVTGWIQDRNYPAAWLSLDSADSDPTRFLTYLIHAIQKVAPNVGANALAALQSSQPLPPETTITILLNDLAALAEPCVLVLDDYHTVDSQAVDAMLAFLLEHLPPHMHLMMTTREDPNLPLPRLRGRGYLTELRSADLRFTPTEATDFFNQMMGLTLSEEEVAALEARTEGWITGLQLAALALQNKTETAVFIQAFTGSHRFILDYLVEEVLGQQSEPVRDFLLQTSILSKFNYSLCTAVTAQENSQEILKNLERENLFLIPLDDERHWYRYHHLFADVLQTHLHEEQPDLIAIYHVRASVWYEAHQLLADAIEHALIAQAFARAAHLLERVWPAMEDGLQAAWLNWAKQLPDQLIQVRPVLSHHYGWALLDTGDFAPSETYFLNTERWLDQIDDPQADAALAEMVIVDQEQVDLLPGSIAVARAYRALGFGEVDTAVQFAQDALDLLPETTPPKRGAAASLLGLARYATGDLVAADRALTDFRNNVQARGAISDVLSITFILAEIKIILGRLQEAMQLYQTAIQLAAEHNQPLGTADLHRGISELYIERNDLATAQQQLDLAQKLSEQIALPDWEHRLLVSQARLKIARGDLDGAIADLQQAEQRFIPTPLPPARPTAAVKARVWIAQGQLALAAGWAVEQGITAEDELDFMCEFEHMTLARLFIAQYQQTDDAAPLDSAIHLLSRLLPAAEAGRRNGNVIEILLLQALAHEAKADTTAACQFLERALRLAEPEGYLRTFLQEGQPLVELLAKVSIRDERLNVYMGTIRSKMMQSPEQVTDAQPPLVDPLSDRELDVLRLLATELSGPQIADELIISLNTMRTHTKNIYSKLGVNSRRTAVHRAQELNLI